MTQQISLHRNGQLDPPPSVAQEETAPLPPPPPNITPEQQSYFDFWGRPLSALEKQSQLSSMQTAKNIAYRALWGAISIPSFVLSKAVNWGTRVATDKALEAITTKAVGLIHTPEPNTPLRNLHNCLKKLSEIVSADIAVGAELKRQASEILDDFLSKQKIYLQESSDPETGFRIELDFAQENRFATLSNALKHDTPLEKHFINDLYDIIKKCWTCQQQFHAKKMAQQMLKKVTSTGAAAAGPGLQTEKKDLSRFYETLTSDAPRPVPKNAVPLIVKEIGSLKSLGFKIALALLILPKNVLHRPGEQNGGLLTTLIEKSEKTLHPLKDSNEIFQNLIFTQLDNSGLNFVQRTWKKFLCILLAPSVFFIIDHLLEQSKDLVLYLIGVSPEERLKLIFKMFIEPGREFICKLQSQYIFLGQNAGKVETTPEMAISNAIANIKIKDRATLKDLTPKDLINRLVSTLISRYAPSLNWSSAATEHFEKRAQNATSILLIVFRGLSYLSWVTNMITAPARWCLHKIIHTILKIIAVNTIHSKLQDSSDSSWDFGQLALNSLYKTLLHQLKKKNRRDVLHPKAEDSKKNLALEQTAFVDKSIQDNISKLVFSFLQLLYIQGSDLFDLSQKLAPNNNVEQTKKAGMELFLAPGVQKITEQIIHGLQTFLEEKSFSAVILELLQDIQRQCREFNFDHTKESLAPIEQAFYTELQEAVKSGIQEAIDEKLDPSKHIQSEANLFIDGLKRDIIGFQEKFEAPLIFRPSDINLLVKLRDTSLFTRFKQRFDQAQASTNRSAMLHINDITENFFNLREPISNKITDLSELTHEFKKTIDLSEELEQLILPLTKATTLAPPKNATSFYSELQLTLQKVKDNRYPDSVQKHIRNLQREFEACRTEVKKRDHYSLLNSLILTLTQEVQRAIEKNQGEALELSKRLTHEYQQTKQLIADLAKWALKLNNFTCKVEPTDINTAQQMFAQYAGSIPGGLSPLILKQLDAFFQFLGKDHNVKGLLWYIIKAYLEMPPKSPQEFEKILTEVRAKLKEPLSPPHSAVSKKLF